MVSIYPGRDFFDDSTEAIRTLVPADAEALAKQGFVDSVSPEVNASDNIRFLGKSATATINGVGRDHFRVNGIELLQGSTFQTIEMPRRKSSLMKTPARRYLTMRDSRHLGKSFFWVPCLHGLSASPKGTAEAMRLIALTSGCLTAR